MRTKLIAVLKHQANELLAELRRDGAPVSTSHQAPRNTCLSNAESFETLQRRVSLLQGIARGERAMKEGRTLSHMQARARMTRWLG